MVANGLKKEIESKAVELNDWQVADLVISMFDANKNLKSIVESSIITNEPFVKGPNPMTSETLKEYAAAIYLINIFDMKDAYFNRSDSADIGNHSRYTLFGQVVAALTVDYGDELKYINNLIYE